MSGLEDRCVSFHEAAMGTGKSKGATKEIATLRRFLHKNQNQRFTDKATARLFDTIQIYATDKNLVTDDREGLLEDGLKMPFTVFATKQKKTMLKWIEEVRGGGGGGSGSATVTGQQTKQKVAVLTIMDVVEQDDTIHLMTPAGDETFEVALSALTPNLRQELQKAFDATEESLEVKAILQDDGTVTEILELHKSES